MRSSFSEIMTMRPIMGVKSVNKGDWLKKYSNVIIFAILFLFNSIFTKNFLSIDSIWNLITQSTTAILIAISMTVVMFVDCIDISVGSTMALSAVIFTHVLQTNGNPLLAVLLSALACVLCGLFCGYMVGRFKIQPMIASLAMMYIVRGIARVLTNGKILFITDTNITSLSYYRVFGVIPIQFFILLILSVAIYILMNNTRFGVRAAACGDSAVAARAAGIRTELVISLCFIITALFACLAGIIECIMVACVNPSMLGLNFEGTAIAATVMGGGVIAGRKFNVIGAIFGALVLQLITIMFNMWNIDFAYSTVVKAIIIILAVYFQNIKQK